ncbi:Attractin-like protein 1 [Liparis tanakae]|uniref:Attractin-like protein 1 n=1 Tax=Liparis tanakae TaxID=230148 RepID=A0A4Z2EZP7_9TELE|nr:Attractin-like protein 1 [Liparis tanakae]
MLRGGCRSARSDSPAAEGESRCRCRGPSKKYGFPPHGIAIASALVDTSQQRLMDFKERGLGLKYRKHTVLHQGTCIKDCSI